jgi:TIR domain
VRSGEDLTKATRRRDLFLSFDERDTAPLAARLASDLGAAAFAVRFESPRIAAASKDQIQASDAMLALMSPHSVGAGEDEPGHEQSICLEEIAFARFGNPRRPIIPVMAITTRLPLMMYRLHYVDMRRWEEGETVYAEAFDRLVRAIEDALAKANPVSTAGEPDG